MEAAYELIEQPAWKPIAAEESYSFSPVGSASKDAPTQELRSCPHPCIRFFGSEFESIPNRIPSPVFGGRDQHDESFVFRNLSKIFSDLAVQWKEDTWFLSSSAQIARHPAYRKIIDMGETVVPLILEDLRRAPDQWFVALSAITGVNPVSDDDAGIVDKMRDSWLQWGRENNYI